MRTKRECCVPALAAIVLSGCWVPAETGKQMQDELAALRRELQEARKQVDKQEARLAEQVDRADAKITEVARTLDDLNRAARMTDADFGVKLDHMVEEVQTLRGATELADYRLGKAEQILDGPGALRERVEALERGLPDKATPSAQAQPPQDKKELFAYAEELTKKKETAEARGVYRDIVKRWPKEAGTTDRAYFQLGELYYTDSALRTDGRLRSALPEYIKVIENFPKGTYADDALYRLGMCAMGLGNLEDAKVFFTEILKKHKRSPLVKYAKEKLKKVDDRLAREKKQGRKPSRGR